MKKKADRDVRQKDKLEQLEIRQKMADYRYSEYLQRKQKKKADREALKLRKAEMKAEFRERTQLGQEEWQRLSRSDREKFRREKLLEREEKKRQRREARHQARKNLADKVRSFSIRKSFRKFRDDAPKRRLFLLISGNSTVLFLLSYLVLFLVYQAVTVISASFFDYPTIVHYYEIYFNISPEAWYHDSVKTIFASGPVIVFIIGIIFLIIYSNLREMPGTFKLFFLWGFLHGVNMLFGALLIGTLFETGVGHVISWMYVMDTGKVLYSMISIFILVIAGLITVKSFLISGNSYFNEMTRENRSFFLRAQVLIPYLAGNAILFIMRQPRFMYYETFVCLILIISILPVFAAYRSYHDLFFDEDERKPRLAIAMLLVLVIMILFYRGVLQFGIRFGG